MTSSTPGRDPGTPEDLLSQRPAALEERAAERHVPRKKPGLTAVLGSVVAAGALFAGGLLVGHATGASTTTSQAAGVGAFGAPGDRPTGDSGFGGGSGGFTSGEITSIDGSTVTLKSSDGSTVTISTTDGTTVTTTTDATVSDLGVGDTVTVIGATDSSGKVTAQAITEGATGIGVGQMPGQAPTS